MNWLVKKLKNRKAPVIPTIPLNGVIGVRSLRGAGLTARTLAPLIKQAFAVKRASAVALIINSPGGSPAQTSLIARLIRREAQKKDLKVLAFVEDVGASGGYWLACAADEIFIDASSIVGSIGVISAGFGFQEAIRKLGIERRVYTAGTHKSMLDPFSDQDMEEVAYLKEIQGDIHETFKDYVRQRRSIAAEREPDIFDGRVFVGNKAVEAGLADRIGHISDVIAEKFGDKAQIRMIEPKRSLLPWRQTGLSEEWADGLIARMHAEAHWQRFGL